MENVISRFLRYVKIDTASDPDSTAKPSTEKQLVLSQMLAQEMTDLGLINVITVNGYVYGLIPATIDTQKPTLGFVAHVDTAPDAPGANVKPRIVENYRGGDIVLNEERNIVMTPTEFESLADCVGQDLIVTDGTTLLGADDKAGVAEIMTLCERLMAKDAKPHCAIAVAFTPDEEVGAGADDFDIPRFGADFAYTVDGGALGEIEYENFNAAGVKLTINGLNIHPGTAKNKMKNAVMIASEFISMLPKSEAPEHTEGYEGFYHVNHIEGCVEFAAVKLLIRDHDRAKYEAKKANITDIVARLNAKYGEGTVMADIKHQYSNMEEYVRPHMHLIDNARASMEQAGVKPLVQPIRGGTDGARLSEMGLPCPNLSTGGLNFHGRFEYIPVQSLEKMVDVLENIVERYSK